MNGAAPTELRADALAAVIARLRDDDWRVRDAAVAILAAAPSVEAIPALIDALASESLRMASGDGRKRVRARISESLQKLTGAEVPPFDAGRWRVWWEASKPKFRLGGEVAGRPRTRAYPDYFQIPIRSDRLVFAIDVSNSMLERYGAPPLATGAPESVAVPPSDPRAWTKLERVKNELVRVVRGLGDSDWFQVVAFDSTTRAAFPALVPATRENKRAAERFVVALEPGGGTAIFDAIGSSLGFGVPPKQRVALGADTLFLLSDGAPTAGLVVATDEILARTASVNRRLRAEIHTLYVGGEEDAASSFLRELSKSNGGEHRRVPER